MAWARKKVAPTHRTVETARNGSRRAAWSEMAPRIGARTKTIAAATAASAPTGPSASFPYPNPYFTSPGK